MVYTSYFPYWKKVQHPIAISRQVPKWYGGEKMEILAPSWELLRLYKEGRIDKKQYAERYISELISSGITSKWLRENIPDNCTLLCWEVSTDFCHRHILAHLLRNAGIDTQEWEPDADTTESKASS